MANVLDSAPILVALDIGGTNSRGEVLLSEGGKLSPPLHSAAVPTPVQDGDAAMRAITSLSEGLLALLTPGQRDRVVGVGLGVPGVLDGTTGMVKFASNLGWRNRDLGWAHAERRAATAWRSPTGGGDGLPASCLRRPRM